MSLLLGGSGPRSQFFSSTVLFSKKYKTTFPRISSGSFILPAQVRRERWRERESEGPSGNVTVTVWCVGALAASQNAKGRRGWNDETLPVQTGKPVVSLRRRPQLLASLVKHPHIKMSPPCPGFLFRRDCSTAYRSSHYGTILALRCSLMLPCSTKKGAYTGAKKRWRLRSCMSGR